MLKPYHLRLIEGSFLQRIYGIYKLTYKGEYVRVVVLENSYGYQNISSELSCISHSIKYKNCLGDFSNELLEPMNFEIILSSDVKIKIFDILDKDIDLIHSLQIPDVMILLVAHSISNEGIIYFKAEINKKPIHLSIVISEFLHQSSSKSSKRLYQDSIYPKASKEDIRDTLSRIIK
jgi:hypothetical protein